MRTIAYSCFLLLWAFTAAHGGWFGYDSYEDCMLGRDAYGKEKLEKWNEEIKYFLFEHNSHWKNTHSTRRFQ